MRQRVRLAANTHRFRLLPLRATGLRDQTDRPRQQRLVGGTPETTKIALFCAKPYSQRSVVCQGQA